MCPAIVSDVPKKSFDDLSVALLVSTHQVAGVRPPRIQIPFGRPDLTPQINIKSAADDDEEDQNGNNQMAQSVELPLQFGQVRLNRIPVFRYKAHA